MSPIERIDSAVGRVALHGVATTRAREAAALTTVPAYTLMARAGAAVARLALALAPHARRVLVFAGTGNNGGDGIEAATRLVGLGKRASIVLVGDGERRPVDAARALAGAIAAGVAIESFNVSGGEGDDAPDVVIDALLGIGASRAPEGVIAAAIERIAALAARGARVLAVDVPSGLDADRGRPLGPHCVVAADTLTMLTLKPGLFTAAGRDHAGRAWLARLGVIENGGPADAWLVGGADPSCVTTPRPQGAHKGSFGDVAVVGGDAGMAGAAWLAARAAHAAGAGRVFVDLLGANDAATSPGLDPCRPELMFRGGWWRARSSSAAAAAARPCVRPCPGSCRSYRASSSMPMPSTPLAKMPRCRR
jgi:hydroxyethylthiazole kinase-like uncharacterized protein yjeF